MSAPCEARRLSHLLINFARARVYVFIILNSRAFGTDNC